MTANELRIGNLVNHHIYGQCEITALDYEMICIQRNDLDIKEWFELEDYQPIPLTEEWLLKFGFENKEFTFDKTPFFLTKRTAKKEYLYQAHTDRFKVKYVHQLQNLYFALTGEEL